MLLTVGVAVEEAVAAVLVGARAEVVMVVRGQEAEVQVEEGRRVEVVRVEMAGVEEVKVRAVMGKVEVE
jgi:hypothetical protein